MNSKSEKLVLKRFNKEFTSVLENILGSSQVPAMISIENFRQLMKDMGCIRKYSDEKMSTLAEIKLAQKESLLITEIQNFLTSCNQGPRQFGQTAFDYNKISVANIKVILMAVFKIKGNKRLEVEMPDELTSKMQ